MNTDPTAAVIAARADVTRAEARVLEAAAAWYATRCAAKEHRASVGAHYLAADELEGASALLVELQAALDAAIADAERARERCAEIGRALIEASGPEVAA